MAVHFKNIRKPKSFFDFLIMNTKGETSKPMGFRDSTDRAPWFGNSPGFVGSYALYEDYDGPEDFDYDDLI
jgi:hypothetical protein